MGEESKKRQRKKGWLMMLELSIFIPFDTACNLQSRYTTIAFATRAI
jgi:hypothetical protein